MASWQAWKKSLCTAVVLGAVFSQSAFADAVLSISATPPASVGSTVGVDVLVTGITDLYGYNYTLSFNSAILQASSITEGSFLGTGGSTFFDGGSIDNTGGSISFTFDTLIGNIPGVSGGGVLAHINFNTLSTGTSALVFSDVTFLNSIGGDIAITATNGSLQVAAVPEPASLALFAAGLAGIAGLSASRRRKAEKSSL